MFFNSATNNFPIKFKITQTSWTMERFGGLVEAKGMTIALCCGRLAQTNVNLKSSTNIPKHLIKFSRYSGLQTATSQWFLKCTTLNTSGSRGKISTLRLTKKIKHIVQLERRPMFWYATEFSINLKIDVPYICVSQQMCYRLLLDQRHLRWDSKI